LIPKNNLLQITVPDDIEDFDIINYGYVGTWIIEKNAKKLNAWKQKIPNGNYEILGRIKDVTDGTVEVCGAHRTDPFSILQSQIIVFVTTRVTSF
jgi:hypothetical protein